MEVPQGFSFRLQLEEYANYKGQQSPRAWFDCFHKSMINFGYKQSNGDHIMFIKHQNRQRTVLIVYVDDIIIFGANM